MVVPRLGLAVVLALAACASSDGPPEARPEPPEVPEPPAPDEADDGAPTAAALRKRESLQAEPIEGEDCGTTAADSGWPTTLATFPDESECLVGALAASEAATQTFTGRTGDGGALLTRYVVRIDGTVEVTRHVITADGEATSEVVTCEPPPGPWGIGVDGAVVVDNERVC